MGKKVWRAPYAEAQRNGWYAIGAVAGLVMILAGVAQLISGPPAPLEEGAEVGTVVLAWLLLAGGLALLGVGAAHGRAYLRERAEEGRPICMESIIAGGISFFFLFVGAVASVAGFLPWPRRRALGLARVRDFQGPVLSLFGIGFIALLITLVSVLVGAAFALWGWRFAKPRLHRNAVICYAYSFDPKAGRLPLMAITVNPRAQPVVRLRLASGRTIETTCSTDLASRISEGDGGTATLKGNRLIAFARDRR